jgi:hypothetical protein
MQRGKSCKSFCIDAEKIQEILHKHAHLCGWTGRKIQEFLHIHPLLVKMPEFLHRRGTASTLWSAVIYHPSAAAALGIPVVTALVGCDLSQPSAMQ